MNEKQTILIVDDAELNRALLRELLGAEYDYLEAACGTDAVELLRTHAEIDLVLLDVWMPDMDGFGVLEIMNRFRWTEQLPVIMISVEQDEHFHERAYDLGAADFIQRPFNAAIVRRRVENILMLYARQKRLTELVSRQIYRRTRESGILVDVFGGIIGAHCGEDAGHSARIRAMTSALLRELGRRTDRYHLSEEDIARIGAVSAFYDVGKLRVPAALLASPRTLTPEELDAVRAHTVLGEALLAELPVPQDDFLLRTAREICRWHHERWDGGGYPDGLRGDAIPIAAQAVSLADAFTALTEHRARREAYPRADALAMLRAGECGTFNPLLLDCLEQAAAAEAQECGAADFYREETGRLAEEIFRAGSLPLDERPRRLLEAECEKRRYYARLLGGVELEYDALSRRVTLTDWRPGRHGQTSVVEMSRGTPALLTEEDLAAFHRALLRTTPQAPECSLSGTLRESAGGRSFRLCARTLWSRRPPAARLGAVGMLLELADGAGDAPPSAAAEGLAIDPLTGARSRWYLESILPESAAFGAAAMLDVDRFKSINDLYGHAAGDAALCAAAAAVSACLRPGDLIIRTGGDEFLLLFPEIGEAELAALLAAVRGAVAAARVAGYPELRLSVSIGSAWQVQPLRSAIREADRSMYRDKARGERRDAP